VVEAILNTGKAAFKYFHEWEFRRYRAELNGVVLIRNYLLLLNRQEISIVYNHSRKDVKTIENLPSYVPAKEARGPKWASMSA
jgi:hypothetical protein